MTVDLWALIGLFGAIGALWALLDDWKPTYPGWDE